ncbi:MAG TPA: transposase [Solirubrobacteraceae bacterium]|nr:transposase [Solirubrobacteraceae bacterium]
MPKVRSWVGLDVHAAGVVACVVDAESGEMTIHRLAGARPGWGSAPGAGEIERPSQDRVKTDVRDAGRLARLSMIDALHPVRVPTPEDEALRDLVRAREDVRGGLMRARHRLSKLLLRHDVRYGDTSSPWGERHRRWPPGPNCPSRGHS